MAVVERWDRNVEESLPIWPWGHKASLRQSDPGEQRMSPDSTEWITQCQATTVYPNEV